MRNLTKTQKINNHQQNLTLVKMRYIILSIIFIFLGKASFSQSLFKLEGKIIDLLETNRNFIIETKSKETSNNQTYNYQLLDSAGTFYVDSLIPGEYIISIVYLFTQGIAYKFEIKVDSQNINKDFVVPVCKTLNISGICPKCNEKDSTYQTCPNLIYDVWFEAKEKEEEYWKKIKRQGYHLTKKDDACIIWIETIDINSDYDPCNPWFCIRDKLVF